MLVTFSVIIDDVVFPDGSTRMGRLGGGGPQTAFGARHAGMAAGIAAGVGRGLERTFFELHGIDTAGLREHAALPTLRAWQLFEADGRRTQVWRSPRSAIGIQLARSVELLPPAYRAARAFHLGVHPEAVDVGFLAELRALPQRPLVSVECFRPADGPIDLGWIAGCDVLFANEAEAISLGAPAEPEAAARWLCARGAGVGVIGCGLQGSFACDGERVVSAAAQQAAGDVAALGAGNVYCGAFSATLAAGGRLETAAYEGASAAATWLMA